MVAHGVSGLAKKVGGVIVRDPLAAANSTYDVIVVGGGIYGACTLLEAARRGLGALLIERDDFGGATSWNSLRILHGGLRYLQHLDLRRFRESVGERRWFCQNFPDLVRPLACLMPLYGRGLKRPAVLKVALALNDWLSRHRNDGVLPELLLPSGRLLSRNETIDWYERVDRLGLMGGALWYDAMMQSPQRILIAILRWACSLGATALNYVEASRLKVAGGGVTGIVARERRCGSELEFRSEAVVNCAGPWFEQVARSLDSRSEVDFKPSLAFNLLLHRPPLSEAAVALQPNRAGAPVYFACPFHGRVLAGTFHAPQAHATAVAPFSGVSEEQIRSFLEELNLSVAGWGLRSGDVLHVFRGVLPAQSAATTRLARREVIYDHGLHGGPTGLVSVCGVKFTTARLVAQRALGTASARWAGLTYRPGSQRRATSGLQDGRDVSRFFPERGGLTRRTLDPFVREEAALDADDIILRRTDWALHPSYTPALREQVARLLEQTGSIPIPGSPRDAETREQRSVCYPAQEVE
jgi:glycerol-3-phosphate dehydrogenase